MNVGTPSSVSWGEDLAGQGDDQDGDQIKGAFTMTNHVDAATPLGRRGRLGPTRFTGLARPGTAVASLAVVGLFLAACGSSTPSSATTTTPASNSGAAASPGTTAAAAATVKTAMTSSFGTILVNSAGMALYTLAPGTNCTGACAQAWPALTVPAGTTPTGGSGVTGTLATSKQSNGALWVTYNGKVLYTFLSDSSPGMVTGNGVAGFSVAKVSGAAATTTTTSSSSGGSQY
jgi:predicted lipoprotein with Yx(FWY)xxD motif